MLVPGIASPVHRLLLSDCQLLCISQTIATAGQHEQCAFHEISPQQCSMRILRCQDRSNIIKSQLYTIPTPMWLTENSAALMHKPPGHAQMHLKGCVCSGAAGSPLSADHGPSPPAIKHLLAFRWGPAGEHHYIAVAADDTVCLWQATGAPFLQHCLGCSNVFVQLRDGHD